MKGPKQTDKNIIVPTPRAPSPFVPKIIFQKSFVPLPTVFGNKNGAIVFQNQSLIDNSYSMGVLVCGVKLMCYLATGTKITNASLITSPHETNENMVRFLQNSSFFVSLKNNSFQMFVLEVLKSVLNVFGLVIRALIMIFRYRAYVDRRKVFKVRRKVFTIYAILTASFLQ